MLNKFLVILLLLIGELCLCVGRELFVNDVKDTNLIGFSQDFHVIHEPIERKNPFGIIKTKKLKFFRRKHFIKIFFRRVRMKRNCVFRRFELYKEFTRRINKKKQRNIFIGFFFFLTAIFLFRRVLWPFSFTHLSSSLCTELIWYESLFLLSVSLSSTPCQSLGANFHV